MGPAITDTCDGATPACASTRTQSAAPDHTTHVALEVPAFKFGSDADGTTH